MHVAAVADAGRVDLRRERRPEPVAAARPRRIVARTSTEVSAACDRRLRGDRHLELSRRILRVQLLDPDPLRRKGFQQVAAVVARRRPAAPGRMPVRPPPGRSRRRRRRTTTHSISNAELNVTPRSAQSSTSRCSSSRLSWACGCAVLLVAVARRPRPPGLGRERRRAGRGRGRSAGRRPAPRHSAARRPSRRRGSSRTPWRTRHPRRPAPGAWRRGTVLTREIPALSTKLVATPTTPWSASAGASSLARA